MTHSTPSKTAWFLKSIAILSLIISFQFSSAAQCGDLYIAGVIDGGLSGGGPKGILICANNNIPDLSIYGVGSANNGGGTDMVEFTFPAATASAGDCFWVGASPTQFMDFFGFNPCYVSGAANINGDDAIELFCNGAVVDVFGEIDCDPNAGGDPDCISTPSWEYTDGWAFTTNTVPGAYNPAEWTFSGINALDGVPDNASAPTPFPLDTQTCPSEGCSITNVAVSSDGACAGDDATYTVCFDAADGSGDYDLIDTNNGNAVLSSLTGQADGNICFMVTVVGPTTAGTLSVDVVDNADASCVGGTPVTVIIPECPVTSCTITNVTVTSDGACSGDDATYTVCADVAGGSGDYDLVDTNNGNAVLSALTGQADGNICFTVTLTGPTTAATLSVDVLDNADAACISGTPATVTIPSCPMVSNCTFDIVEFVYDVCNDSPLADGTAPSGGEYVIIQNTSGAVIDLSGAEFDDDGDVTDGDGTIIATGTMVPAGGCLILAAGTQAEWESEYGPVAATGCAFYDSSADWESLNNGGDMIGITGACNNGMYSDNATDGQNVVWDGTDWVLGGTVSTNPGCGGQDYIPNMGGSTTCTISGVNLTSVLCNGDDATYQVCATVLNGSGDYDLVDTANANAVLASLTAQADGMICFDVVLTGPTTATTIMVDVVDNMDSTCTGGTSIPVAIPVCPVVVDGCDASISTFPANGN